MMQKTRKRYNAGEKRRIVEQWKEFHFHNQSGTMSEFADRYKLSVCLLSKWIEEYKLGWYATELFGLGLDSCKSYKGSIDGILRKINFTLSTKFPEESEMMEVFYVQSLGYGVRAKKNLMKKTRIGFYRGEEIEIEDGKVKSDYIFSYGDFKFIDAQKFDSCYARYINHPPLDCEENLKSKIENGVIELKTSKDIEKGNQLFLRYGYSYWEEKALNAKPKEKQTFTMLYEKDKKLTNDVFLEEEEYLEMLENWENNSDEDYIPQGT